MMADYYQMDHPRRGKAVVISNENFPHCGHLRPLSSLQHNVNYLTVALQNNRFEVDSYKDLSKRKTIELLERVASEDHSDADCLVVCLMSHGNEDGICGIDYDGVRATDLLQIHDIVNPFVGDRCPSLIGKPKIFIINACRGSYIDQGVEYTDGADSKRIPSYADILIMYSCCDGHISSANRDYGSFFMYSLSKNLDEFGHTESLANILLMVKQEVAKNVSRVMQEGRSSKIHMQMPVVDDTLRKQIFFGTGS